MELEKYRLILADPPWPYNDQGTRLSPAYEGKQRKSGKRYDIMTMADICALGEWVRWITEKNAILLLWSTNPIKETHPWPVIKAWGFKYSTSIPWVKARWDEKEKRFIYQIGGGKTTRSCSEELLVCTKGKGASLVTDRGIPGAIIAPRAGHSVKPVEQYMIAERMVSDGPYLELFARARRPGWDAWGNEI
ncbi:MAG: MT-A70 family methyltransferase [Desulfuromonadaceae bacterium]